MNNSQFPLREKRKAQTRSSLIRSAHQLFAKQGYEATTLEAVADHAGLHVQTLYRHFASKHELATAGDVEEVNRFRLAIRDETRSNNTFSFWREWVADRLRSVTRSDGGKQYREYLLQRWGTPTISSQLIRIGHEYEDLLTESLAKDFGESAQGAGKPRLVAIMLWGVNGHITRQHAVDQNYDLERGALSAIDSVEQLFGHLAK